MKLLTRNKLIAIAAITILAGVWFVFLRQDPVSYRTAMVERGDLHASVSATGSLGALVTVEVGSQLSGKISQLFADFNSEVAADQVIARIDPEPFETRVAQAEAELAVAEASVQLARANLSDAEATLREATNALTRAQALRRQRNISEANLDTAVANADKAKARLAAAEAELKTAQAQVKQREASLGSARVDLEYTFIRSPVNGVVIGRSVSVGQTVAASLQTPILFTIAQDLSKMQVEVSVDEADIGKIERNQKVIFTVDAYPEREFFGRVDQVRKQPVIEQNVVTYTVIVSADNKDQKLLPGMTANVDIVTAAKDDVLLIPNAALRYRPPEMAELFRSNLKSPADRAGPGIGLPQGAAGGTSPAEAEKVSLPSFAWRLEKGDLVPVPIETGISDDQHTEIIEGDIHQGDLFVIGRTQGDGREAGGRRSTAPVHRSPH